MKLPLGLISYFKRVLATQKSTIHCSVFLLNTVVIKKLEDVFYNIYTKKKGLSWKNLAIASAVIIFFIEVVFATLVFSLVILLIAIPLSELELVNDVKYYITHWFDKCKTLVAKAIKHVK